MLAQYAEMLKQEGRHPIHVLKMLGLQLSGLNEDEPDIAVRYGLELIEEVKEIFNGENED